MVLVAASSSQTSAHSSDAPRWFAPSLVGGIAIIYALLATKWVLGGDNGEFATLSVHSGLAHPPGYPLYILYLRATSWIPSQSPAHGAALATGLLGAAAGYAWLRASQAWGAAKGPSAIAVALFAASPLTLLLCTQAEVWALNSLLAGLILGAAGPFATTRGTRRCLALGVLAGLALAHHHSAILLIPVGAYGLALGVRESGRWGSVALAALLGAATLVSVYWVALLVARNAADAWIWGGLTSTSEVLRLFFRSDYGTLKLGIIDHGGSPLEHVASLLRSLARQGAWLALPLAVVGFTRGWTNGALHEARSRSLVRWGLIALAMSFVLCGPLFVSRFNLSAQALDLAVVRRFYLLPLSLLVVPMALGAQAVMQWLPIREAQGRLMTVGICILALAGQTMTSYQMVSEHHRPSVEWYLLNVLRSVPPDAVLLGSGDARFGGFLYMHDAKKIRPDVEYVDVRMMLHPWYAERTEKRLGLELTGPENGNLDTVQLGRELLAAARPLFTTSSFSATFDQSFVLLPHGIVDRVLPKGTPVPTLAVLEQRNAELFSSYLLESPPPQETTHWGTSLAASYARPWQRLALSYESAGDSTRAKRCQEIATHLLGEHEQPAP